MKEIEGLIGDHISKVCAELAREAPAFTLFNDIRVESKPGDTARDLVDQYEAKSAQRRKEHEAKRRAFDATPEGQRRIAEAKAAREAEQRRRTESLTSIERSGIRTRYPWATGMGEISGFGGGYEAACRDMLYAGLLWLELHDMQMPANRKDMEDAVLAVCPDCSGAMHGAVMSACRFISMNGWAKYAERMTR